MSVMTMVTRIIPSSAAPDSYEALPRVSDLCRGSKINVNTFTEPKTGISYQIETAFVEMKVPQECVKEMQKQIADHCETQQMTCLKTKGLRAVQDSPLQTSAVENNSLSNHLLDMKVNSPLNSDQDVEILRCSAEQNVFLLSIANSIPKGNLTTNNSTKGIVFNLPFREENELRESNFLKKNVQIKLINSKTNHTGNNLVINIEMQTNPSTQVIRDDSPSTEEIGGSSREIMNEYNITNNFNNQKTDKHVLAITNKTNILQVSQEDLITISDENNSSQIFEKFRENSDDSAYVGSEMFELMKQFVDNKCLICGFVSLRKQSRPGHNHMLVHAKQRPFKCKKCDKAFVCKSRLVSHEIVHGDEFPFACKQCDKRFRHVGTLRQHEDRHNKKIRHRCDVCNKGFTFRQGLKKHVLTHTGEKPFACNICSKSYSLQKSLKNHMLWHSGEKPFKCEDCGKAFRNSQYLNAHRAMHQKHKKYHCDICDQKFNFSSNLTQHKLIHSENREHFCDQCDKTFKLPHHLRQHLLTHSQKS